MLCYSNETDNKPSSGEFTAENKRFLHIFYALSCLCCQMFRVSTFIKRIRYDKLISDSSVCIFITAGQQRTNTNSCPH